MKGLKASVIIIISIGGLLSLIPIIFYLIHFSNKDIATDSSVWGVFGDFLGGTINPIIGIVNLAVLIAISIYVAKFDSHRQFNEYRYQIYVDLCKQFDETNDTSDALVNLKAYCEVFKFNNQFLFPRNSNDIFNQLMIKLIEDTDSLTIVKEEFEENVRTGKIITSTVPRSLGRQLDAAFKDWPKTENAETLAVKAFRNSKNNVIGFIQDVMIEKDLNKYK